MFERRPPGGQGGFTLLELVLAMTIMTVGLLVLLAGFSEGAKAGKSAYLYTRAVILSRDVMDRRLSEADPREGPAEGTWEDAPSYRWKFEFEPFTLKKTGDETEEYTQVILTTAWPDGAVERSFQLRTLIPAEVED